MCTNKISNNKIKDSADQISVDGDRLPTLRLSDSPSKWRQGAAALALSTLLGGLGWWFDLFDPGNWLKQASVQTLPDEAEALARSYAASFDASKIFRMYR